MFKHSILSDFGNCPYPNLTSDRRKYVEWIRSMLSCSTEIFAGERAGYDDMCLKIDRRDELLYRHGYHLPFPSTLISYSMASYGSALKDEQRLSSKRSNLVVDRQRSIDIFNFSYDDGNKKWVLWPFAMSISKDDSADDIDGIDFCGIGEPSISVIGREFVPELVVTKTILDVLSCKNVSLTPVEPPEKLNKKRIKNGKQPLYRYHVLTVDLDKGRKQSGVGRGANLGTMPVHLCRGHFKEYTTEKPLFGRVTGRFWWQPYARGKAENGVVMKDYEIKKSNV